MGVPFPKGLDKRTRLFLVFRQGFGVNEGQLKGKLVCGVIHKRVVRSFRTFGLFPTPDRPNSFEPPKQQFQMSKFKCQIKSQCLNVKTLNFPQQLNSQLVNPVDNSTTRTINLPHLSFDIWHSFELCLPREMLELFHRGALAFVYSNFCDFFSKLEQLHAFF